MPSLPADELRWEILRTLEDYEGDVAQLSCRIPSVIDQSLREYAESFASPKITKSQIVQWALVEFVRQHKLTATTQ